MWRSHSLWYSFAAISESGLGRLGRQLRAVSNVVRRNIVKLFQIKWKQMLLKRMQTGVHLPELQVTIV